MKIRSFFIFAVLLTGVSIPVFSVFAQSGSESGGGLGGGISTMVRGILNDGEESEADARMMMFSAPTADAVAAPSEGTETAPAAAAVMMKAMAAPAPTEEDAASFVRATLTSDERIRSIDVSDGHVRVSYNVQGTFLKLFKIPVVVRTEVYASGDVRLIMPWFARMPGSGTGFARLQERMSGFVPAETFDPALRIQILTEVHAFLLETYGAGR